MASKINVQSRRLTQELIQHASIWLILTLILLMPVSVKATTIQAQTQDTGLLSPNPLTTYVGFKWSSDLGGSIAATYCIAANYHWLRSADIAPVARFLGSWSYQSINNCETRLPALGTPIGQTVEIGIGASATDPRGSLAGTDYYHVTRTGPSTVSAVYHHSQNSAPQVIQTPVPSGQVCPTQTMELQSSLQFVRNGASEIISRRYEGGIYEGTSFWPSVKVQNTFSQQQQVNLTFDISWSGGSKRISRTASISANSASFVTLQPSDAIATDGIVDWAPEQGQGYITVTISADKCSASPIVYNILVRPRPVIRVHGFRDSGDTWGWYPVWLNKLGIYSTAVEINLGNQNPAQSIESNGSTLASAINQLRRNTGAASVDVIAHSMGGLVARYYIHSLMPKSGRVIRQLIMLATPNGGTSLAWLPVFWSGTTTSYQLTPQYVLNDFNQRITDRNGVIFNAVAGKASPLGVLCQSTNILRSPFPIASDCIVPVDSVRAISLVHFYIAEGEWHNSIQQSSTVFSNYVKPMLQSKTSQIQPIVRVAEESAAELTMLELAADQLPVISTAKSRATAQSSVYSRTIKVDNQDAVTFNLSSAISNAQVTLADPRGVVVDTFTITQTVPEYSLLPQYSYTVEQPESGAWTLTFDPINSIGAVRAEASTPHVAVLALGVQDPSRRILIPQDPRDGVVGTLALVQARISSNEPLTDVTVHAEIQSPSGQKQDLSMGTENGLLYQTSIDLQEEGIYTINMYADGVRDGTPFRRVGGTSITVKPAIPATCDLKSQGDANCDGRISLIDFELFRREYANARQSLDADFNGDGQVTLSDFEIWRASYVRPRTRASTLGHSASITATESMTVSLETTQQQIEATETITVDVFLEGSSNAQTSGANLVVSYPQDAIEYQQEASSSLSTTCQTFNKQQGVVLGAPMNVENDVAAGRLTIARVSQGSALPSGRFCVGTLVFKPHQEVVSGTLAQVMLDDESRAWDIVGPQTAFTPLFDPERSRVVVQIGEGHTVYLPLITK